MDPRDHSLDEIITKNLNKEKMDTKDISELDDLFGEMSESGEFSESDDYGEGISLHDEEEEAKDVEICQNQKIDTNFGKINIKNQIQKVPKQTKHTIKVVHAPGEQKKQEFEKALHEEAEGNYDHNYQKEPFRWDEYSDRKRKTKYAKQQKENNEVETKKLKLSDDGNIQVQVQTNKNQKLPNPHIHEEVLNLPLKPTNPYIAKRRETYITEKLEKQNVKKGSRRYKTQYRLLKSSLIMNDCANNNIGLTRQEAIEVTVTALDLLAATFNDYGYLTSLSKEQHNKRWNVWFQMFLKGEKWTLKPTEKKADKEKKSINAQMFD